jgi:hypothetical protein
MHSTLDDKKILRRSDRVDETRIGDRFVLYHRDTGSGVVLNPSGSAIWDSLSVPKSTGQLIEEVAGRHPNSPRDRIADDVAAYVSALREQLLVDERP